MFWFGLWDCLYLTYLFHSSSVRFKCETQWESLVWTIEYYISRNIFIARPSCSINKSAPCIIEVVDLSTWYSWFQIKLHLRIIWRKWTISAIFCGICRLHKGWWVLFTSSISSQRTVPYFQSVENEPRPLGIHWAHRGLSDAKLGWEVKSWLLLMADLWCPYFQIVNAHQGRLVGLTQFSSRHQLWCITRKAFFSPCWSLLAPFPLLFSIHSHFLK